MGLLLKGARAVVTEDVEKAEVLGAFFALVCAGKISPGP